MTSLKTSIVLRHARELISEPHKWTQGEYARDHVGEKTRPDSLCAVRWCAVGALSCAALNDAARRAKVWCALEKMSQLLTYEEPHQLNDNHDHDLVLWMFDLTIADTELKEAESNE